MNQRNFHIDDVVIRGANIKDCNDIIYIYGEADKVHYTALPDIFTNSKDKKSVKLYIESLIKNESSCFVVAQYKDRVIGVINVSIEKVNIKDIFVPRTYAEIVLVAVDPIYRGLGVGKKLIKWAESWAWGQNIRDIELNVWEFNKVAIGLYEKLGYKTRRRILCKSTEIL